MTTQLANIINNNPTLTIDGFGIAENFSHHAGYKPELSQAEREAIASQKRQQLLERDNVTAFEVCRDFLRTATCTKKITPKNPSSYRLKDCIERWAQKNGKSTYIPMGTAIAAVLSLAEERGFMLRSNKKYIGAEFNIQEPAFA